MVTRFCRIAAVIAVLSSGCGNDEGGTVSAGGSGGSAGTSGGGRGGTSGDGGGMGGTSAAGAGGTRSGGGGSGGTGAAGSGGTAGSGTGPGLAFKYPGDVGIENDPDVVWVENFEEGSVDALVARYEDKKRSGLTLDTDLPPMSSGKASGKFTASGSGPNAVDLFKKLTPGFEQLHVRYYAKYGSGAEWHHTGVWVGGYNPASNWPNPQAGLKPNGDDRFSVSLEPMGPSPNPRLDFYNYWMKMHSWMDQPSGNTAYYGNSLVHRAALVAADGEWMCVEIQIKLNPDAASGAGAELGLWVNDQSIVDFTETAPLGYWVKDKFCPEAADGTECTDYKPPSPTLVALDLQYRSTLDLKLNAFWPQNYITSGGAGSVWYDDMVVAKVRIGCVR